MQILFGFFRNRRNVWLGQNFLYFVGEMISLITDWIAKLGQAFCHHQYVHKHIEFEYSPYVADYYECRKCGRFRLNEPPESLIYKESKK